MEDMEIFERYQQTHDIALRNEIAEKYLYIAAVIAKKFVGRGVDYDDLYQVASLALLKGVERFDPSKGLQFSTFITPTITGEIKNYFRDKSRLIYLPRRVAELRASLKKATEELTQKTGKKPTARELAQYLKVSEEEVVRAMEAGSVVSLDRTVSGEDDGMSYYDVLPADGDSYEEIEERDAVESALKELTDEEKQLVQYRFREELSQTETAKRMNVSQMFVSRLERKVLKKVRENYKKSFM